MKIYTEKEAEEFLENQGFNTIDRIFVSKNSEKKLKKECEKIGYPLVMKISGEKIIHKNNINGIKTGIADYKKALATFQKFKLTKNSEGVLIQKQAKGKEFLLGIKKTPEFEHVISFGAGGVEVEKIKDISFRICPIEQKDINEIFKEIVAVKNLNDKQKNIIKENLMKLCKLVEKFPKIKELDINPLMISNENGVIVDARISFE